MIQRQVDQQAADTLIVRRTQLLDTIYTCKEETAEPQTEDTEPTDTELESWDIEDVGPCEPRAHLRARQEAVLAFVQIERKRGKQPNLRSANLRGAHLYGADLGGAILTDAILTRACP